MKDERRTIRVDFVAEPDKEGDILKAQIIQYIASNPLKWVNLHNIAYEVSDYVHKPKE